MLFMNQDRIYGRTYRDESGGDGDGDAGGTPNAGDGEGGDDAAKALAALQEQFNQAQAENTRLAAKIAEANKHAKAAERAAAEEARKKAEADGNYEQLFKSSEEQRSALEQQLNDLRVQNESKEINSAAMKIAASLADGENVDLLARFVAERLKYAENGVKVTDSNGDLTVSSLDDLKKEFAGSTRFAALIKGNQSSGGGASGGSSSGSATKEMTRADFDALDPYAKSKFMKDGGKLTD